jgi:hypothetical protein
MSRNTSSIALTQAINWLALEFRVPEGWEIARHGIRFDAGSLVFIDRARQRLSVSWTECPRAPDLERLFSDFANQPREVGETVRAERDCHGFRVLECELKFGERVSHALRFDARSRRLIELELAGTGEADDAHLMTELLASFVFSERGERSRIRAFGVHAELPAGFELCMSRVNPADVTLEFERKTNPTERAGERVRIRRSGMARAWFDGDGARALRQRNPELRFDGFDHVAFGPHPAVAGIASPRVAVLKRLLGRATPQRVVCWECPTRNAVFELSCSARAPSAEELALWCCAELREAAHGS